MLKSAYSKGFSLLELAIVIIIVGLLVAGVLAGRVVIHNAELRRIIAEVENYKIQIDNFAAQYGGLPGDITDATEYWGDADVVSDGAENGDGNGRIGSVGSGNDEVFDAWHQLVEGRFIVGSFDSSGGQTNAEIGVNVPESFYNNAGYSLAWHDEPGEYEDALGRSFKGNVLIFASDNEDGTTSNEVLEGAILTPEDAYAIDIKIDNEQPDFGSVLVDAGFGGTDCITGTAPNIDYDFSTTDVACRMYFHIQ